MLLYYLTLFLLSSICSGSYILHFSDVHLDLEYHEGASSKCWFPCFGCCHPTNIPFTHYEYAYKYGSRMCGAPKLLLAETLNWVRNKTLHDPNFSIDLILFTGDSVGNHVTYLNPYQSFAHQRVLADLLQETFPNTPIVFTPGNHDTWPINQYGRYNSFLNGQWYSVWKNVIPEDQRETFLAGGYYSVSPYEGLRVLSINSLWGETKSFVLDERDAEPMYQWINSTLSFSRQHSEKVYIIYHIVFQNGEQTPYMTQRLRQLFSQYSDVIVATFGGHTHKENNFIYYSDLETPRASSPFSTMAFIAPALKYEHGPASFRVYQFNNSTYEIEDLITYQIDAFKSQVEDRLVVTPLGSYREHFNMTSFTTEAFDSLFQRMRHDKELFDKYASFYFLDGKSFKCKTNQCRQYFVNDQYL